MRDSIYARVALAVAALGLGVGAGMIAFDLRVGRPPIALMVAAVACSVILFPLLFKRETRVESDTIHVKFDWVNRGKIEIAIGDIRDHRIAPRPPQSEWSQGPSQDATKVRVLWARSDQGVMLTMRDGQRIFIASEHPHRFNRAIARAIRRHGGML